MKFTYTLYIPIITLIISCCSPVRAGAQKIDTISTFSVTTYVDAYYAWYRDSVGPGNNQRFAATAPRSNSPSLDIAQVSFQYLAEKIRATATFHYGDLPDANWPHPYNNIQEAHIGFKVYSKLWIDAGFFLTHMGTEFLTPAQNITSSLAVGTYYEPFYESGIRFNFDPTTKLEINLFLLNGYNMFVDNNNRKSFGMGVTYAFNPYLGIGYTNYIGDDSPDTSGNHLRIAQNVFLNYQRKRIKIQIGGDYFLQQNADLSRQRLYAGMYSALATIKYQCTKQFAVYTRGEIFHDPDGFVGGIITDANGRSTGYKLFGITAGMEYKPTPESYVKLEGRYLQMDPAQDIFYFSGYQYSGRYEVMVNAGMTFDLLKNVKRRVD